MGRTTRWAGVLAAITLAPPVQAQEARPVIVVLPFENSGSYGQDKENFEALEAGLPAILAATLAAHPGAQVAEPGRTRAALGQQQLGPARRIDAASASQIAKAAGARYAVTGSFADFYGKFRINARVVDAQSGEILKVVSNDDPKLQDRAQLGAIVQLVGDRVVAAIGLPPYPAEAAARLRAVPTEALTQYSRGILFESRGDKAKAAEAYRRALVADPSYSEARDGLQRVQGA
jgi:TolB-like protein